MRNLSFMSRSDMLTLACIGFSPLLASQGRDIAYAPRTVGHGWKTLLLIADLQADPGQQGFTVQAPKPILVARSRSCKLARSTTS